MADFYVIPKYIPKMMRTMIHNAICKIIQEIVSGMPKLFKASKILHRSGEILNLSLFDLRTNFGQEKSRQLRLGLDRSKVTFHKEEEEEEEKEEEEEVEEVEETKKKKKKKKKKIDSEVTGIFKLH
ncbi:hypothetical protein HZH68_003593 [Vespula germanica]|uniref:Uncharacterized protein n=1 Tax=Vespula germanica TaxID=30212 RepID=A0A834NPJ4_VESGE|nr:hypothetical protein HZH68_003593 [Vespula germanica]